MLSASWHLCRCSGEPLQVKLPPWLEKQASTSLLLGCCPLPSVIPALASPRDASVNARLCSACPSGLGPSKQISLQLSDGWEMRTLAAPVSSSDNLLVS